MKTPPVSNSGQQAVDVYNRAFKRFQENKDTNVDKVILSLMEQTVEQSATIRALTLKLSFLETAEALDDAETECTALLARLGKL
nr:hypothetical protein [uncultured Albidiferax sp.]